MLFAKKAKEAQSKGGGSGDSSSVRQKSDKPIDTKKEIAKLSNVSHDTVVKVKFIKDKIDDK